MVKLRNRADNTEQSSEPSDDPRVCAVLCNSKMQVDALKVKLSKMSKMSSQQSRDMEVPPKRCRAANAELLSVLYNINYLRVTTDCGRDRNISLMKSLNKLMNAIYNGVEEAAAYRNNKVEQAQRRLREVDTTANAAQNQELADLEEIQVYKIMHLFNRLTNTEHQASKFQNRGRCAAGDSYDQKMRWKEIVEKRD